MSWDPSGDNLIVVHGDDPNTAAIDGAHGEIIWKTNIDGQAAVLFASYGSYGIENILEIINMHLMLLILLPDLRLQMRDVWIQDIWSMTLQQM